jgi:hypothetical protein
VLAFDPKSAGFGARRGARAYVRRACYFKGRAWYVDVLWMDPAGGTQRDGGYRALHFHPLAQVIPLRYYRRRVRVSESTRLEPLQARAAAARGLRPGGEVAGLDAGGVAGHSVS